MAIGFGKADAARERMFEELAVRAIEPPKLAPPDPERRRVWIREAGARLFAQRGLDGVSFSDIAASLKMPLTTCTHYYRTRDELVHAILYEHAAALEAALEAADPVPSWGEPDPQLHVPPMQRMDAIALALLDALAERQDGQRVLLAALHTLPELSEDAMRHLFRGLIWRVERVLLLAVPRLRRRRALLFPVAASFTAMAAHYVLWFRDSGKLTRAEYGRLIARMAVAGGKAAYREQVGKARGMGEPETLEGALLGVQREKSRWSRSPR